MPTGDDIVGEARDPDGTRVALLGRVWRDKVVLDHPEMGPSSMMSSAPSLTPTTPNPILSVAIGFATTRVALGQASGCSWS